MKNLFLFGLVILMGAGLLLAGCSSNQGTHSGQPLTQPMLASKQPQAPSPLAGSNTSIDASAAAADQALNDQQSTLQAEEASTPGSSDQSLNDADQSLNDLLQTIQAEPTP